MAIGRIGSRDSATVLESYKFTASGGETSLSGADSGGRTLNYPINYEVVFLNGVRLVRGDDYTATTGTSITGLSALTAGDVVDILVFQAVDVADAISQSYADGTYVANSLIGANNGVASLDSGGQVPGTQLGNAVTNALIQNTRGALITSTGSAVDDLAPGANGETLVADSAATLGLRWQPAYNAGRNRIINGGFDIWQRGTSFSFSGPSGTYTADRWAYFTDGTGSAVTVSRQAFTPGAAPAAGYEGTYFIRYNRTAAGTGNTYSNLQQPIEDVRTFAGQTVTISFWAKASASMDILSSMTQEFGSGGSSEVNFGIIGTASLTTSWQRFSFTTSVPSVSGKTIGSGSKLFLFFYLGNTVSTVDIWGVQVEAGSVATRFEEEPVEATLRKCQRYYQRFEGGGAYRTVGLGFAKTTSVAQILTRLAPPMRIAPTSVEFSGLAVYDGVTIQGSPTSIVINTGETGNDHVMTEFAKTGLTQYRPYSMFANNSSSAYLAFSAEL